MCKCRNFIEVVLENTRPYSKGLLDSQQNQRRKNVCYLAVVVSPPSSFAVHYPPDKSTAQTSSSMCSLLPLLLQAPPISHLKLTSPKPSLISIKNDFYGPVQIPNEVTVALMTPPTYMGSKTSQEADDNRTTVLSLRVVQGCQNTRSPNPLLYLIHTCNNWIMKPSTTSVYISSHHMCPTLQTI